MSVATISEDYSFWSDLSQKDQLEIRNAMLARRVAGGETLIEQGSPAHAMFVVNFGRFEVKNFAGQLLAEVGAGQLIGEIGFFADELRTASVVAARRLRSSRNQSRAVLCFGCAHSRITKLGHEGARQASGAFGIGHPRQRERYDVDHAAGDRRRHSGFRRNAGRFRREVQGGVSYSQAHMLFDLRGRCTLSESEGQS